jgi:hypothetical protein
MLGAMARLKTLPAWVALGVLNGAMAGYALTVWSCWLVVGYDYFGDVAAIRFQPLGAAIGATLGILMAVLHWKRGALLKPWLRWSAVWLLFWACAGFCFLPKPFPQAHREFIRVVPPRQ